MTGSIEQALSTVVDPEVGINVVDMGLITTLITKAIR